MAVDYTRTVPKPAPIASQMYEPDIGPFAGRPVPPYMDWKPEMGNVAGASYDIDYWTDPSRNPLSQMPDWVGTNTWRNPNLLGQQRVAPAPLPRPGFPVQINAQSILGREGEDFMTQGPGGVLMGAVPGQQQGGAVEGPFGIPIATLPLTLANAPMYAREGLLSLITGPLGGFRYQGNALEQPEMPRNPDLVDQFVGGIRTVGDAVGSVFDGVANFNRQMNVSTRITQVADLYLDGNVEATLIDGLTTFGGAERKFSMAALQEDAVRNGWDVTDSISKLWDLPREIVEQIKANPTKFSAPLRGIALAGALSGPGTAAFDLAAGLPFSLDPAVNMLVETDHFAGGLGVTMLAGGPILGAARGVAGMLGGGRAAQAAQALTRGLSGLRGAGTAGAIARGSYVTGRTARAIAQASALNNAAGLGIRSFEWGVKQYAVVVGDRELSLAMDRLLWEMPLSMNPGLNIMAGFYTHPLEVGKQLARGRLPIGRAGRTSEVGAVDLGRMGVTSLTEPDVFLRVAGRPMTLRRSARRALGTIYDMNLDGLHAGLLSKVGWPIATLRTYLGEGFDVTLDDIKNFVWYAYLQSAREAAGHLGAALPGATMLERTSAFVTRYSGRVWDMLRTDLDGTTNHFADAVTGQFWDLASRNDSAAARIKANLQNEYDPMLGLADAMSWIRASKEARRSMEGRAQKPIAPRYRETINPEAIADWRRNVLERYAPDQVIALRDIDQLKRMAGMIETRGLGVRLQKRPGARYKITRSEMEAILDDVDGRAQRERTGALPAQILTPEELRMAAAEAGPAEPVAPVAAEEGVAPPAAAPGRPGEAPTTNEPPIGPPPIGAESRVTGVSMESTRLIREMESADDAQRAVTEVPRDLLQWYGKWKMVNNADIPEFSTAMRARDRGQLWDDILDAWLKRRKEVVEGSRAYTTLEAFAQTVARRIESGEMTTDEGSLVLRDIGIMQDNLANPLGYAEQYGLGATIRVYGAGKLYDTHTITREEAAWQMYDDLQAEYGVKSRPSASLRSDMDSGRLGQVFSTEVESMHPGLADEFEAARVQAIMAADMVSDLNNQPPPTDVAPLRFGALADEQPDKWAVPLAFTIEDARIAEDLIRRHLDSPELTEADRALLREKGVHPLRKVDIIRNAVDEADLTDEARAMLVSVPTDLRNLDEATSALRSYDTRFEEIAGLAALVGRRFALAPRGGYSPEFLTTAARFLDVERTTGFPEDGRLPVAREVNARQKQRDAVKEAEFEAAMAMGRVRNAEQARTQLALRTGEFTPLEVVATEHGLAKAEAALLEARTAEPGFSFRLVQRNSWYDVVRGQRSTVSRETPPAVVAPEQPLTAPDSMPSVESPGRPTAEEMAASLEAQQAEFFANRDAMQGYGDLPEFWRQRIDQRRRQFSDDPFRQAYENVLPNAQRKVPASEIKELRSRMPDGSAREEFDRIAKLPPQERAKASRAEAARLLKAHNASLEYEMRFARDMAGAEPTPANLLLMSQRGVMPPQPPEVMRMVADIPGHTEATRPDGTHYVDWQAHQVKQSVLEAAGFWYPAILNLEQMDDALRRIAGGEPVPTTFEEAQAFRARAPEEPPEGGAPVGEPAYPMSVSRAYKGLPAGTLVWPVGEPTKVGRVMMQEIELPDGSIRAIPVKQLHGPIAEVNGEPVQPRMPEEAPPAIPPGPAPAPAAGPVWGWVDDQPGGTPRTGLADWTNERGSLDRLIWREPGGRIRRLVRGDDGQDSFQTIMEPSPPYKRELAKGYETIGWDGTLFHGTKPQTERFYREQRDQFRRMAMPPRPDGGALSTEEIIASLPQSWDVPFPVEGADAGRGAELWQGWQEGNLRWIAQPDQDIIDVARYLWNRDSEQGVQLLDILDQKRREGVGSADQIHAEARAAAAPPARGYGSETAFPNPLRETEQVPARFRLVDVDQLVTSADEGFNPELQPRQRDRAASREQIEDLTANFDPNLSLRLESGSDGPAVVGADNMVLAGNGRTAAMRRFSGDQWVMYHDAIRDRAAEFGIRAEDVGLRDVLVREVPDEYMTPQMAQALNARTGGMSSAEMALAVASMVTADDIAKLGSIGETVVLREALKQQGRVDFNRRVLGKLTPEQARSYVDAEGNLSDDGARLIANAMIARVIPDPGLVTRLIEAPEDLAMYRNGIEQSLGQVVTSMSQSELAGVVDPGAGAIIGAGLRMIADLTDRQVRKRDWPSEFNTLGMFGGDQANAMGLTLAGMRNAGEMATFMRGYATALGNSISVGMFEEGGTAASVINAGINAVNEARRAIGPSKAKSKAEALAMGGGMDLAAVEELPRIPEADGRTLHPSEGPAGETVIVSETPVFDAPTAATISTAGEPMVHRGDLDALPENAVAWVPKTAAETGAMRNLMEVEPEVVSDIARPNLGSHAPGPGRGEHRLNVHNVLNNLMDDKEAQARNWKGMLDRLADGTAPFYEWALVKRIAQPWRFDEQGRMVGEFRFVKNDGSRSRIVDEIEAEAVAARARLAGKEIRDPGDIGAAGESLFVHGTERVSNPLVREVANAGDYPETKPIVQAAGEGRRVVVSDTDATVGAAAKEASGAPKSRKRRTDPDHLYQWNEPDLDARAAQIDAELTSARAEAEALGAKVDTLPRPEGIDPVFLDMDTARLYHRYAFGPDIKGTPVPPGNAYEVFAIQQALDVGAQGADLSMGVGEVERLRAALHGWSDRYLSRAEQRRGTRPGGSQPLGAAPPGGGGRPPRPPAPPRDPPGPDDFVPGSNRLDAEVTSALANLARVVVDDPSATPLRGWEGTQYDFGPIPDIPGRPGLVFDDYLSQLDGLIPGVRDEVLMGRKQSWTDRLAFANGLRAPFASMIERIRWAGDIAIGAREERKIIENARSKFEEELLGGAVSGPEQLGIWRSAPARALGMAQGDVAAVLKAWDAKRQEAVFPVLYKAQLFRRTGLIPAGELEKIATAVIRGRNKGKLPAWYTTFKKKNARHEHPIAEAWFRADNRIRGAFANGPLDGVVKLWYDNAVGRKVAAGARGITVMYHLMRFPLDIRWVGLEATEGAILTTSKEGIQTTLAAHNIVLDPRTWRPRRLKAEKGELAPELQPLTLSEQDLVRQSQMREEWHWWSQLTEFGTQYARMRYVLANVAKRQERELPSALLRMARSDSQLSEMLRTFGATPQDWLREMDAMWDLRGDINTRATSPINGSIKLSREDAARLYRPFLENGTLTVREFEDMVKAGRHTPNAAIEQALQRLDDPIMRPLMERLAVLNDQFWTDATGLIFGQVDRSNLQRFMNHPLLWWPTSYMVKATKWLAGILFDRAFGRDTGMLGAITLTQLHQRHQELLTSDPEYREFFKSHETLFFVAQMFLPVSPYDIGVSLSPMTRTAIGAAQNDPSYMRNIFSWGPFYTFGSLLPRLAQEISEMGGPAGEIGERLQIGFPLTYTVRPSTSRLGQAEQQAALGQPSSPSPFEPQRPPQ